MGKKLCNKCRKNLCVSNFRTDKQGRNGKTKEYIRPECKNCEKRLSEQLKKAKLQATEKPEKCECCFKAEKLILDHDHSNGNFRGWLCRRCNLGIGKLGDDLDGLVLAINYMLKYKNR